MLGQVRNSIGAKVILVAGLAIAGVMFTSNLFLVSQSRDRSTELVLDQARLEAEKIAVQINSDIGIAAAGGRSSANPLAGQTTMHQAAVA